MLTLDDQLSRLFGDNPDIQLAIIFGSLSLGTENSESDMDIAVAGESKLDAQQKIYLIEELAAMAGRPIDLIDLHTVEGLILLKALTTGRIIYCINRKLYAELIIKMLCNQADMMPYREQILERRRKAWINA